MAKKETIPWNKGKPMSSEYKKHWFDSMQATCLKKYGGRSANFKGGKVYKNGYIYTYVGLEFPGHDNRGYYPEHKLIAEKALKRKMKSDEIVHHINGKKDDNRNCNLLICTNSYHLWLERKMSNLYKQEHFS